MSYCHCNDSDNQYHSYNREHGYERSYSKRSRKTKIGASLRGFNEVPPNDSHGTGKLYGYLTKSHDNEYMLDYTLYCAGLGNSVISVHFHDGRKGLAGPILQG